MAYTNNRFRGYIDGKTIWDYSGKLDYSIDKLDKRLDKVSEVLNLNEYGQSNDEFWQEIWDMGICKAGLNVTDDIWSDTNVAKCLEGMGTYLLSKSPKDPKCTIKVYDDYELFKRILKEKELINKYGNKEEDDIIVFKTKKNYKLAPKETLKVEDRVKYPEINDYYEFKQYLLSLSYSGKDSSLKKESDKKRMKLVEKINSTSKTDFKVNNGKLYQMIMKQLPLIEDDMFMVKASKERPIKWKSPLKDSGNKIDWEYLDMFDPEHVKPLLQYKGEVDISSDILIDMYELIEKTELDDRQKEILSMWRSDKTQQHIADELKVCRSVISKQLDKIVKKVISAYEKEYEENHYYLNVVKGKYKTCSKCGEVKLIQRFDKNGKRGHMSMCKSCR